VAGGWIFHRWKSNPIKTASDDGSENYHVSEERQVDYWTGMVVVTRTTLYLRLQRCLVIEVWIADLHPPGRRRESSETTGPCSEIHPSVSIDVISSRSQRPQARRYGRNATGEPVAALRRARGSAAGARRKRRSAHPLDLCRASRGLLEGF